MTSLAQKRSAKKYQMALREEMFKAYGDECSCCGEKERAFLTLEHVNRDGKEHRALVGQGYGILIDLRKRGWPRDGFTVNCMNCNFAKRYGSPCPHEINNGIQQFKEAETEEKTMHAYMNSCFRLGIESCVKRSREECNQIIENASYLHG